MGLNNRWMAEFLQDVGEAIPDLRADLNRSRGRSGPFTIDILAAIQVRVQQLISRGDIAQLRPFVEALDLRYQPGDRRLREFNANVEQWWFESWSFRVREGRVSWLTFTPKLRRSYKSWVDSALHLQWEIVSPPNPSDLPDT
ncbi:hypothetical protein [Deinococcus sonorensis]|uniref:Uncharacterized protein n=2 Tax=Deinococcus sonorensis TaxID=309891 RepID=A0AAU7U7H6_9DEIO